MPPIIVLFLILVVLFLLFGIAARRMQALASARGPPAWA
jgi:hypothetical protein